MAVELRLGQLSLHVPLNYHTVEARSDKPSFLAHDFAILYPLVIHWVSVFLCLVGCRLVLQPVDVSDVNILVAWQANELGKGVCFPDLNSLVFTSHC